MATQVTEFGAIPDEDKLYAKTADGSRVLFPSGYKGYDISEDGVTAKWVPIVVTILSDPSVLSESQGATLTEFRIDKRTAIKKVQTELRKIHTEYQAEVLLEYLSRDTEIGDTHQSKTFSTTEDALYLFFEDLETASTGEHIELIYNLHGVIVSVISEITTILTKKAQIEERIQSLSNENLHPNFQGLILKYARRLQNMGEGEGVPDLEQLGESEQRKAEYFMDKIEYLKDLEERLSESMRDFPYNESLTKELQRHRIRLASVDRGILNYGQSHFIDRENDKDELDPSSIDSDIFGFFDIIAQSDSQLTRIETIVEEANSDTPPTL